jgi:hypothetical protein
MPTSQLTLGKMIPLYRTGELMDKLRFVLDSNVIIDHLNNQLNLSTLDNLSKVKYEK